MLPTIQPAPSTTTARLLAADTPADLLTVRTDAYTCGGQQALRRLLSFSGELLADALQQLRHADADPGALPPEHVPAFEEGYHDVLDEAAGSGLRWVDAALVDMLT